MQIHTASQARDCKGSWNKLEKKKMPGNSEEGYRDSCLCLGPQVKVGNKGYRKDQLAFLSHVLLKTLAGTRTFENVTPGEARVSKRVGRSLRMTENVEIRLSTILVNRNNSQ